MDQASPTPEPAAASGCTICGYSLAGLDGRGLCPECGHTDHTARAELHRHAKRIQLGVKLVHWATFGLLLVLLLLTAFVLLVTRIVPNAPGYWETIAIIILVPLAVPIPFLMLAGVWMMTAGPDPDTRHTWQRLATRAALMFPIIFLFIGTGIPGKPEPLAGFIAAGMAIAAGLGVPLLGRVRRDLATRFGVGGAVRTGLFGTILLAGASLLVVSVPLQLARQLGGGPALAWDTFAGWTAWLLLLGLLYHANMFVRVLDVAGIVRDPTATTTAGVAPGV